MSYRRKENKPDNGMGKIEFTMSSTFPLGTIPKVQFSKFCQDYNPKTYVNVLQKNAGRKRGLSYDFIMDRLFPDFVS